MYTVQRYFTTEPCWQNVCLKKESRLRPIIWPQILEEQMGFGKNRSCTDVIFTLRQLVENNIEYNRNIFVTFVDQEKVFERVARNILWKTTGQYGVNAHLINNCYMVFIIVILFITSDVCLFIFDRLYLQAFFSN
jgi:hypothetical protein